jgi:hypothetical protein
MELLTRYGKLRVQIWTYGGQAQVNKAGLGHKKGGSISLRARYPAAP